MNSQTQDVLELLREGPVTPLQSWSEIGVYRLGARVYDLRREGYEIECKMRPYVTTRGRKVRISVYTLLSEPRSC